VRLGLDWTSQADLRLELGLAWLDIFKPPKSRLELGLGLCGVLGSCDSAEVQNLCSGSETYKYKVQGVQ
jgi:hypothetical protein